MENANRNNNLLIEVDCKVMHGFSGININELKEINFFCLCLNIRSMRKNWNTFYVNIKQLLSVLKIIILVEINVKENENCLYSIDGFKV